jgi:hypothetical protein
MEALGYAVGAMPIEAASAGADHRRDRIWFVAHAAGDGCQRVQRGAETQIQEDGALKALAARYAPGDSFAEWRQLMARSEIRRLAHGVSSNVDVRPALRAFGNAIDLRPAAAFIQAAMNRPLLTSPNFQPEDI